MEVHVCALALAQSQPLLRCWKAWLVRERIHCAGRSVSINRALCVAGSFLADHLKKALWLWGSVFERFTPRVGVCSFSLRLVAFRCLLLKLHVGIDRLFAAARCYVVVIWRPVWCVFVAWVYFCGLFSAIVKRFALYYAHVSREVVSCAGFGWKDWQPWPQDERICMLVFVYCNCKLRNI